MAMAKARNAPRKGEALDDYLQRRAVLFCAEVKACGLGIGEHEALRLNAELWTREYKEGTAASPR